MQPLLTSKQMRDADTEAIDAFGLPELLLMEHAAMAVAKRLETRFGRVFSKTKGVVFAGPGNNGGDALAVARLVLEKGCKNIVVILVGEEREFKPSTALQLKILSRLGIPWTRTLDPAMLSACDWCVDGIFGTGLTRPVEGRAKEFVSQITRDRLWVVSIDIPSGLSADTGVALGGVAVRASETVCLGFYKRGLVTGSAADYVGRLTLATIQIPRTVTSVSWNSFLYTNEDARRLPARTATGHKGVYGHVGVVLGGPDKEGASILAALAALRSGAGLVTILASLERLSEIRLRLPPEIMVEAWNAEKILTSKMTALVVGPGLASENAGSLLNDVMPFPGALVLDADALNWMSENTTKAKAWLESRKDKTTVLTPHPKEAGRLLGQTTEQVEANRYDAVTGLATQWKAWAVLKGKGTLVQSPSSPIVAITTGDSGLSKGGSGDLLSGLLASLLSQHSKPAHAIPLAVYIHGRASERLSQKFGHSRSSLASEITLELASCFKELE